MRAGGRSSEPVLAKSRFAPMKHLPLARVLAYPGVRQFGGTPICEKDTVRYREGVGQVFREGQGPA